ncbi:MAG: protein kinase domain-containing protein, partial [Thermoanaerobaculia bacterium]
MEGIVCPACGRSNSEFDSQCSSCGAALPLPSAEATTLIEGHPLPPRFTREEASASREDPLLGRQISHFRIQSLLGRGGMGVVYQAIDLELGRVVALKFLSHATRSPRDEARFHREARAAAALDHPNIGTIYEVGEREGRRFIAMAFYDGETLAARISREPGSRLPIAEAASIAGQLASALAAAHAAGVVHRDLKPENVMITRDGRVKLLDFGLAKWAEAPTVTEQGVVVGTAAYMAPEQLRGEESGAAGDLWAFGVVLYQMLTGERPFGGERKGMVHAILFEDPPPLHELRPDVPEALERIANRCLAKEPEERFPDAASILAELSAAGLWESGTTSASLPARPGSRRSRWPWLAAAVLLLLAGAAAFFFLRKPGPPVYVAVLTPEISGSLVPDDNAQVRLNLQTALLRAVGALDGLAALDTSQVNAISGPPAAVARAVAAGEVVASQADCAGDLCQVSLRRLDGADGRVLWSDALRVPSSDPRLFANAVAASLRRGYADRDLRVPHLELEIDQEDYRTFLDIRQRLAGPGLDRILSQLAELRQRAPSFLDASVLEAKVARKLYTDTGEKRYLERGLAVARQAHDLAPDDARPLDILFSLNLDAGRDGEAEAVLEKLEEVDPAGSLLRRGQLAERRGQ